MAAHQPPFSWDSPGKNTGVGCHFLLHCMKVKSESEVAQSCLTLGNPMDCSLPGSSAHGIFQARVLEWGAIAFFSEWPKEPLKLISLTFSQSCFPSSFTDWRRKWQPAPVFLPGGSQGWGSLVGCHLWGRTESDTTEVT